MNLIFMNSEKEEAPDIKSFYGPPTSCSELGALGHTLNGYYLVKRKDKLKKHQDSNSLLSI